MWTIYVEISGPVRKLSGERRQELEMEPGGAVRDALTRIGFPGDQHRMLSVTLDGRKARPGTRLTDGGRLKVHLMIGGG